MSFWEIAKIAGSTIAESFIDSAENSCKNIYIQIKKYLRKRVINIKIWQTNWDRSKKKCLILRSRHWKSFTMTKNDWWEERSSCLSFCKTPFFQLYIIIVKLIKRTIKRRESL